MAPLLLAGLAALGGGLLDQYNGNKTLRKQNEQVRRGIEETRQKQRQASALLGQSVEQIAQPRQDEESSLGEYMAGMRQAMPQNIWRGGGDDFDVLAGGAEKDVADYGNDMAGTFAALDAPGLQRQAERNTVLDTGTDFDRIRDQVQTQQYLRQLKINSIRPNPWLQLASSGLRGFGQAAAAGGFSGGYGGAGSADAFLGRYPDSSFMVR